jgi:AcrR family transcriptional regulator
MAAVVQFPNRRQQADETRQRLLDLAWDMVHGDGPEKLNLRQLAGRAGVAVGLPYAHFKSRDGLLDALRLRFWDHLDSLLAAGTGMTPDTAQPESFERMTRLGLTTAARFALTAPNLFRLIALQPGATLSDEVFARELRTAQPFIAFLMRGQEAGEFHFDGDPTVFALALWTSIQGYVLRMGAQLPEPMRAYQERVLEEIFEAFFARIRRRDAGREGNR